jgi:hypothetical protein
MANWHKIFRVSGCLILSAGFVLISPGLFLGAMLIAGSERTIYERAESPNGSHEARVQFDDGGALSGFERLVFVKSTWNPSDAPLLSCRAFWGHGQADIDLSWQDETTLVIEHHVAPDNVAHFESNCGSVRIVTSAVEPFEDF